MPTYWKMINMVKKKNKHNFRMEMVQYALKHNVSAAAQVYKSTRKTVRKWRDRYLKEGPKGLIEQSRAANRVNNKMSAKEEAEILKLREYHKDRWGAWRLKDRYDLERSVGAIHRVIKQHGRVRKKKRKWQVQVDLREKKAQLRPFAEIQWDTKDLIDIPNYYEAMCFLGLPRYQYTARDVRTGALYISHGRSNNSTNMATFARYVLEHLKGCGVNVCAIRHQSDNGPEFQKTTYKKEMGAFESVVKSYKGATYDTIPPRHCTWQSDVETSHRLIEDELYCCEPFRSKDEFYGKAAAYQLYFNNHRANRYKIGGMPITILKKEAPDINTQALNLQPILLDANLDIALKGGYVLSVNLHVRTSNYPFKKFGRGIWCYVQSC